MSRSKRVTDQEIRRQWRRRELSRTVGHTFKDRVELNEARSTCLKDSHKSSVWRLEIVGERRKYPLILKIFKKIKREESLIEFNMLRKTRKIFTGVVPDVYFIERNVSDGHIWVGMEFVRSIKDRGDFNPHHFINIVPSLAKLHASTFNEKFTPYKQKFSDWLPMYQSSAYQKKIRDRNEKTRALLDEAMERKDLKKIIKPLYPQLKRVLSRGPLYFPEVLEAGQSIVHSDLHTANIGCNDINSKRWKVKFIDWEGAKYAPCWYDLVSMLGVYFGFRKDLEKFEHRVTQKCVQLYARHMAKRGAVFKQDPYVLYKKAYLQLVLEKSLYYQLFWEINKVKRGLLLPTYAERIQVWGKEMKLFP